GEQKNTLPFTRQVASVQPIAGDWFERYAAAHPYGRDVVEVAAVPSAGSPWWDALIVGAAATAGLALVILAALGVRPRRRTKQAAVLTWLDCSFAGFVTAG